MKKYIDFHTHSTYSDGADDPRGLVRNSRLKGIDVLAITDHDTMAGYEEALDEARKWNVQLIPGVEISTEVYHIIGLNVSPKDREFQNFLLKIRDYQKEICRRRIEILKEYGVPMSMEKLQSNFPKSRLGKYNIFMTMLMDGECNAYLEKNNSNMNPDEIFTFYLRDGGIAGNIRGENGYVSSKEAIEAIHNAGGIAIIAHPFKEIEKNIEETLDELVKEGLDGIEVQPFFGNRNGEFKKYALEKGLIITYGSDFHGVSFYRPIMGRNGNVADERLLERLRQHSENENRNFPGKNQNECPSIKRKKTGDEWFFGD